MSQNRKLLELKCVRIERHFSYDDVCVFQITIEAAIRVRPDAPEDGAIEFKASAKPYGMSDLSVTPKEILVDIGLEVSELLSHRSYRSL